MKAFKVSSLDVNTKKEILISYLRISNASEKIKTQLYELAKTALEIHPDDFEIHTILGDIYYNENQLNEAKKHYSNSFLLNQNQFLVLNQLLIIDIVLILYAYLCTYDRHCTRFSDVQGLSSNSVGGIGKSIYG